MFIGTDTIKQAEITGQTCKKHQSKLDSLQNKAEDHQIKNQGRSIPENKKSFGDFIGFFLYNGKLIFPFLCLTLLQKLPR